MASENRRLFVGGIPRYRKREEIARELGKLVEGVGDVILYPSATDKTKNRGFAFVEFHTSTQAYAARTKLVTERAQLWGKPICVDWAAPEPQVNETLMATVKVLYVRNLMLSTTEDTIRTHFDALHPGTVERVKKLKDFAFIHYTDRRYALDNLARLNGSVLDGAVLEVQLAKPIDKATHDRRLNSPSYLPTPNSAYSVGIGLASSAMGATPLTFFAGNSGHRFTFPSVASELAYLETRMDGMVYQPAEWGTGGPGTPYPLAGDIDSVLAAQKHRVTLLARQGELEAQKLRVLETERQLADAWSKLARSPSYSSAQNTPTFPTVSTATPYPTGVYYRQSTGGVRQTGPGAPASGFLHPADAQFSYDAFKPTQAQNSSRCASPEARMAGGGSSDSCAPSTSTAPSGTDWESLLASSFGLSTADVHELIRESADHAYGQYGKSEGGETRPFGTQLYAPFASSPKGRTSGEPRATSPLLQQMAGLSAIGGAVGGYWSQGSSPGSTSSANTGGDGAEKRASAADSGLGLESSKLSLH